VHTSDDVGFFPLVVVAFGSLLFWLFSCFSLFVLVFGVLLHDCHSGNFLPLVFFYFGFLWFRDVIGFFGLLQSIKNILIIQ